MIVSALAIIFCVKYGLLRGIDQIADAQRWSPKTRGKITGYATSVPEFVCLVAAGLAGVWQAGLWNIASSNIINLMLMICAVLYFRQSKALFRKRFIDEIGFALLAIAVPIGLMSAGLDTQWYLIPALLGFFAVYQVIDRRLNRTEVSEPDEELELTGSLPRGLIFVTGALVAIIIAGAFLGDATASVVKQFGVHQAIAGWILGFVTSIPEMVTFFAVYSEAKKDQTLGDHNDTQEALDNLTGSNMANVGFVYPLGLLAYLVGAYLAS